MDYLGADPTVKSGIMMMPTPARARSITPVAPYRTPINPVPGPYTVYASQRPQLNTFAQKEQSNANRAQLLQARIRETLATGSLNKTTRELLYEVSQNPSFIYDLVTKGL